MRNAAEAHHPEKVGYCEEDAEMDREIARLHRLALQGCKGIQPHIDCYLPAVALLSERRADGKAGKVESQLGAKLAKKMVLGLPYAPQAGTLPDLGHAIRDLMISCPNGAGVCLGFLQQALPCVRRQGVGAGGEQVAICVLLGLLLGLYPAAVRFPPFRVRVALYRRVHCLLTHKGVGREVCQKCPMLLTLAFMEYCAYVIPTFMPVEESVLLQEPGMQAFFATCSMACDTFRQEALVTGEESWEAMERLCAPLVERHVRACKSRTRRAQESCGLVKAANARASSPP